ncbi:MAG TPA: threonine--tRNA ligase [Verrucomicrobia bacterium]|nr:threonine--tRNA ligase [Verrucomicrobiota bacterium]HCG20693.1 threonine--tRNA ligase [Verrucomicrobiota bacterium]
MSEVTDLERRHSAAHMTARAIMNLFDDVQVDIGPATDEGFYYDFDLPHRLSPEDFPKIEAEIARLIALDEPFVQKTVTRAECEKLLAGQKYKLERLADIPEGEPITVYSVGDYVEMCRGPHVQHAKQIGVVKLTRVAGSYYRGDEKNKMLQRVYGIVAKDQAELDAILAREEEAKKRDHRLLGKQLELFTITEQVGPGLVHWLPKGARIRVAIEEYWRKKHYEAGYEIVYTPHVGRSVLWQTSGHLGFYKDGMFPCMKVQEGSGNDAYIEEYYVKPMNCPFHIQVYQFKKRSYRDLPMRLAELGTVYRYEKDGVRHGLFRVRGFTQDDAHIFCTPEQIVQEIKDTVEFAKSMLGKFGFHDIQAYLSTKPAKAVGDPARWDQATESLRQALEQEGMTYEIDEGGGAFYGPKIDMKIKDALGRPWQLGTVQFDFNLPERFDLTYVGADGKEHQPYMVHRALLGSIERFFGILIEHYAGAFPLWLAPEQVRVLPISEKALDYAKKVQAALRAEGFRVDVDASPDKLGAKIREAAIQKVPYQIVVGPRDEAAGQISVRSRADGDLGAMKVADLVTRLKAELEA